jgi:hypothetical protein
MKRVKPTYCFCVYIDFVKFVVIYEDFNLSKYFVTAKLKTVSDRHVLRIFMKYLHKKLRISRRFKY